MEVTIFSAGTYREDEATLLIERFLAVGHISINKIRVKPEIAT
jgi:hypothetical protein